MATAVMAAKAAAAMAEEDAVEGVTALVPTAVLKAEENVVTAEAATVAVVLVDIVAEGATEEEEMVPVR